MPNAAMIRTAKKTKAKPRSKNSANIERKFENTLQMPFNDSEIRILVSELEDIRKKYENVINKNNEVERKLSVFETILRSLRRIDKEQIKFAK